ncbi:MAG: DNA double-strand break repair nuclease NurA [Candidatus Asgardarchaeia archaeon]
MSQIDNIIDMIAKEMVDAEKKREKIGKILRKSVDEINLLKLPENLRKIIYEEKIINPVKGIDLIGLSISAIDGGLAYKALTGLDLIITRASGVTYNYSITGDFSVKYTNISPRNLKIIPSYSNNYELPLDVLASSYRDLIEKELATRIIISDTPHIIFLDGGIFSNPLFHITSIMTNSKILEDVKSVYVSFIRNARLQKVIVAGVIKDSRKSYFVNWLLLALPILIRLFPKLRELLEIDYRTIFKKSNDITLTNYLLDKMERTVAMKLDTLQLFMRVFSDFEEKINIKQDNFSTFYIKTVPHDVPLRVEVYSPIEPIERAVEKISSVIATLSSYSRTFSLPSILVEADNRAKILQRDAELIFRKLTSKVQYIPLIRNKRRERGLFSRKIK